MEQLMLFRDRTSTAFLRRNQTRFYFSVVTYVIVGALRRLGLKQTDLAWCLRIRPELLQAGGGRYLKRKAMMRTPLKRPGHLDWRLANRPGGRPNLPKVNPSEIHGVP